MASSVSSERAFSLAGITISKWRNCLGTDIIEALQFLKCWFQCDHIFHDNPSLVSENILREDNDRLEKPKVQDDEESWADKIFGNDADDNDDMEMEVDGDDDNDVYIFELK